MKTFAIPTITKTITKKTGELYKGTTKYAGEIIEQNQSPRYLARKVLKHNHHTNFTPILWIGQSGTGKSKSMNTLAHEIHEIAEKELGIRFTVRWMPSGSLVNIEHTFATAPKQPTIFIYDDVSNELDEHPPKIRKQVFKALTTVRHVVGSPVFVFSAIHYSKAYDKPLRNVPYLILTSISDEEFTNIDQLWGYKQTHKIREFFSKFESMFERDTFKMYIGGKERDFVTNKPFRVTLVKRIKQCHFMLNNAISCHVCRNPEDEDEKLEPLTPEEFYNKFVRSYNTRANNVLMYWLYINGIPEALARDYRSAWNNLNKLFKKYKVDKKGLAEVLFLKRGQEKKSHRGRKKKNEDFKNEFFANMQNNLKK